MFWFERKTVVGVVARLNRGQALIAIAIGSPYSRFALVVVEEVDVDASGGVGLQGREVVAAPSDVGPESVYQRFQLVSKVVSGR
jgi:hypothetical protein